MPVCWSICGYQHNDTPSMIKRNRVQIQYYAVVRHPGYHKIGIAMRKELFVNSWNQNFNRKAFNFETHQVDRWWLSLQLIDLNDPIPKPSFKAMVLSFSFVNTSRDNTQTGWLKFVSSTFLFYYYVVVRHPGYYEIDMATRKVLFANSYQQNFTHNAIWLWNASGRCLSWCND